jgi:hypothetical protein
VKRKTTKWLGCLLATTAIAVTTATAADEAGSARIQPDNSDNKDKPSDFYAYYTRLEYDDHSNTGQYADLIVQIGTNGRFVFCREFGYENRLPPPCGLTRHHLHLHALSAGLAVVRSSPNHPQKDPKFRM